MGALGAFMAVSSLSSIGTAVSQSNAIRAQGEYQQSVASMNAKIAGLQANETLTASSEIASRKNLQTRQIVGNMRTVQGASGTDVSSGSNALTRIGTEFAGKIDEMAIRNNATRQAWGFKVQAMSDTFQGDMARMTSRNQARQTLLTGGLQAIERPLGIYSRYKAIEKSWMPKSRTSLTVPFDLNTGE